MEQPKEISYEDFEALCSRLDGNPEKDENGFYRAFKFADIEGTDIRFIWYVNATTVEINGIEIRFYSFSISGTWPNLYKNNLNLIDRCGDKMAIIPLERY